VSLSNGKPVWTKSFDDSSFAAGAAIDKDRLYLGDLNGVVRCLAAGDGTQHWESQPLDGEIYAGPMPYGDDILVTCEVGTLTWLNAADGIKRAEFRIEAPLRCTPTITDGRVMLSGCDSLLHIIDAQTAKEISTVEIDAPTGATAAMLDNRVYFGTEGGTLFAINVPPAGEGDPAVAWSYRDPRRSQPIRTAAAVTDKVVVYGTLGKAIYAIDPKTGKEKWQLPTRSRVESSPVIAGDRVVAATTAGKIYVLDTETHEVKWEHDAGGGFMASPAVVDGQIILGNTDGTLYCFGSKENTRQLTTEDTENKETGKDKK
jgi:outer membrane protein assembly factor BamB